jgi:hypothetical protein
MGNSPNASNEPSAIQRYPADEQQPESSNNERAALAEREDGTIRAGDLPNELSGEASGEAVPIIQLTVDEQQPVDAVAESRALAEREDGTNVG